MMIIKLNHCIQCFQKQVCMYFLIKSFELLEKYNTIFDKVSADIKKELDSKPVYNKKVFENRNKLLR